MNEWPREWTGQTPWASSSLEQCVLTQPVSDWKAHPSLASPCLAPASPSPHHRTVQEVLAKGKEQLWGLQEQHSCLQPRAAAGTGWEQSVECADGTVSNRFLTRWADSISTSVHVSCGVSSYTFCRSAGLISQNRLIPAWHLQGCNP